MKKVLVAIVAGTFAVTGASLYAADATKPGSEPSMKNKDEKKSVKAQGGPCTPGAGDSSAAAKSKPQGGDVHCAPEASANELGRTGDPASAEKRK
jgi:hypothetical protein